MYMIYDKISSHCCNFKNETLLMMNRFSSIRLYYKTLYNTMAIMQTPEKHGMQ